jgi:hypothetical protein
VIEAGLLPFLVDWLRSPEVQVQFEAVWALTNMASGTSEQTSAIMNAGAVSIIASMLKSPSPGVVEQAAWFLGNVAGDSTQARDYVLSQNCLPTLCENLKNTNCKISLLRNMTWTLSNLVRGTPSPQWSDVSPAVPVVCRLIYATDEEVLTDALWATSYLSGQPEGLQALIEGGCARRLVELLA